MLAVAAYEYRKKRKARRETAAATAAAEQAEADRREKGEGEDDAESEEQVEQRHGSQRDEREGPSRPRIMTTGSRTSNVSFPDHEGVRARYRPMGDSPGYDEDREGHLLPPSSDPRSRSPPLSPTDSTTPTADEKHQHGAKKSLPHTMSTATSTSKTSKGSHDKGDFRHGSHKKRLAHIPFLRHPVSGQEMEAVEGVWVREEHEAVEWLSLFYDLVVVAVLTVFSAAHELQTPAAIPIFLSYFALLNWCWTSQTYYDVRYQCEDIYHRFCKALQIACFVYMGAASGRWNPGSLGDPNGLEGFEYEDTMDANQSFTTVVLAFIALRAILGAQYAICMILAHRVQRPEKLGLLAQCASMVISISLAIAAVALPFRDNTAATKIGLFYAAFGAEMFMMYLNVPLGFHVKLDPAKIAERYAAFTLIILGEGFIGLTKSFNNAISGLSTSYTTTYSQVFLVIMVIFSLYLFLFSRFSPEETISTQRAFIWQLIHFPLHFGLLLLLAGMVNVVTNISFSQGIDLVFEQYNVTINALATGANLNSTYLQSITGNLDKLTLYPDWNTELEILQKLADQPAAEQAQNPILLSLQYFGQVIVQVSNSYGVEVADEARDALNELYALDTSSTSNNTKLNDRINHAIEISLTLGGTQWSDSLSGVLWLFPTAGLVLILCCIRSITWYKYEGIAHWLVHGTQLVAGVILALLGLLDIGTKRITVDINGNSSKTNAMYNLLGQRWPLAIIGVTYFVTYFAPLLVLGILQSIKGGNIFPSDETIHGRGETEEGTGQKRRRSTSFDICSWPCPFKKIGELLSLCMLCPVALTSYSWRRSMDGYGYPYDSSQLPPDYYSNLVDEGEYLYDDLPNGDQGRFHLRDEYIDEYGEEEIVIDDVYDQAYEEEEEEVGEEHDDDPWLPPHSAAPQQAASTGNTQQVIIGGYPSLALGAGMGMPWGMPAVDEMQKHGCELHPADCARERTLSARANDTIAGAEGANGTVAGWRGGGAGLKQVDVSGLGLALLLILLVLLGLNAGWDKQARKATREGKGGGDSLTGKGGKSGSEDGRGSGASDPKDPKRKEKGNKAAEEKEKQQEEASSGKSKDKKARHDGNGGTELKDASKRDEADPKRTGKGREPGADGKTPPSSKDRSGKPRDPEDPSKPSKSEKQGGDPSKTPGEGSGRDNGKRGGNGDPSNPKDGAGKGDPAKKRSGEDKGPSDPRYAAKEKSERERGKADAEKEEKEKAKAAAEKERLKAKEAEKARGRENGQGKEKEKGKDRAGDGKTLTEEAKRKEREAARKDAEKRDGENAKEAEMKEAEKKSAAGKGTEEAKKEREKQKAQEAKEAEKKDRERKKAEETKGEEQKKREGGKKEAKAEDKKLAEVNKKDKEQKRKEEKKNVEGAKKQKEEEKKENEKLRKVNEKDGLVKPRSDSPSKPISPDEGKSSWLTLQKLLIGLLLFIPLLALLSGGGRGTTAGGGIRTPPARHHAAPTSTWVVSEPSRQVINNVHAQGTDIPINIGSDGSFGGGYVFGAGQVIGEEGAGLPLHFVGPADPDRLFGMLLALALVSLPLLIDYMRGWPKRKYSEPDYLSPIVHYIILAIFGVVLLWKFNRDYGYLARLRPGVMYARERAVFVRDEIRTRLPGAIGATAEGAEALVWDIEDLMFGDGKALLGLVCATAGLVFLSQRAPAHRLPKKPEYAQGLVQVLFVLGALMFGLLFMSA